MQINLKTQINMKKNFQKKSPNLSKLTEEKKYENSNNIKEENSIITFIDEEQAFV